MKRPPRITVFASAIATAEKAESLAADGAPEFIRERLSLYRTGRAFETP